MTGELEGIRAHRRQVCSTEEHGLDGVPQMRATPDEGEAKKTDEGWKRKLRLTLGEDGSGVEERAVAARRDERARAVAAPNIKDDNIRVTKRQLLLLDSLFE